jgi:hypothetical protein
MLRFVSSDFPATDNVANDAFFMFPTMLHSPSRVNPLGAEYIARGSRALAVVPRAARTVPAFRNRRLRRDNDEL